jgi:hypothetical protein
MGYFFMMESAMVKIRESQDLKPTYHLTNHVYGNIALIGKSGYVSLRDPKVYKPFGNFSDGASIAQA